MSRATTPQLHETVSDDPKNQPVAGTFAQSKSFPKEGTDPRIRTELVCEGRLELVGCPVVSKYADKRSGEETHPRTSALPAV